MFVGVSADNDLARTNDDDVGAYAFFSAHYGLICRRRCALLLSVCGLLNEWAKFSHQDFHIVPKKLRLCIQLWVYYFLSIFP